MLAVRFIGALEPTIALTTTRYFWWLHNFCLYEELPKFSCVLLSKHDFLMNSENIREWLANHPESNEYHTYYNKEDNKNQKKSKILENVKRSSSYFP